MLRGDDGNLGQEADRNEDGTPSSSVQSLDTSNLSQTRLPFSPRSLPALPSLSAILGTADSAVPGPSTSSSGHSVPSVAENIEIGLLPEILQEEATTSNEGNVIDVEEINVESNSEDDIRSVVSGTSEVIEIDSNEVIEINETEESASNTENENSSRESSRPVTPQEQEEGPSVESSAGARRPILVEDGDSPADFRVQKRRRIDSPVKESTSEKEGNPIEDDDDDDGNTCSICFDTWTSSGSHRIASLRCGHLFGQSCIEKWLKGQGGKCPQCNAKAKRQDIRVLYAKSLKAVDTTERDQALKDLEREREVRKRIEMEAAQNRLQCQLVTQECTRLQTELDRVRNELNMYRSKASSSSAFSESQISTSMSQQNQSQVTGQFMLDKTIKIWEAGNCRVMSYSGSLATLIVSQPSSSPLFPGFGVKKISAMDFKTAQYLTIHSKPIRDVCFHPFTDDGVLLSCGMDKTLKMTSIISNAVVQTYDVDSAVWSCVWNSDDRNLLYAGLQNGRVLEFDIRNTGTHVQQLNTEGNRSVVSLQYVPKDQQGAFRPGGLLVGQQDRVSFYEKKQDEQFRLHMLPLEGILTSLCFEPTTRHILASFRPTAKHPTIRHQMCELVSRNFSADPTVIDNICSCNIIHTFHSSRSHTMLSKTKIFTHPADDNRLLVCAGEESSNAVHVWDTSTGQLKQQLHTGGIVVDLCSLNANQQTYLAALTSKQVKVFKWS